MLGGTPDELVLVAVALAALDEKLEVAGRRRPPLLIDLRTQVLKLMEAHGGLDGLCDPVPAEDPGVCSLPLLLDYDQASRRLGVSRSTLKRWVAEGRIGPVKVGGIVRFTPESLDRLVAELAGSTKEA